MTEKYLYNQTNKKITIKWLPPDSEEKFDSNLKTNSSALFEGRWTKDSIVYNLDEFGFRNSFQYNKNTNYNLVLGCSFTFGIGLRDRDIWFNYLKKSFSEPFYNGAIPGSSIGGCYRSLVGLMKNELKVKRVFMLTPAKQRTEIFNEEQNYWETVAWWTDQHKKFKKYIINDVYNSHFFNVHLDAIENVCNKNQIEFTAIHVDDCIDTVRFDYARDLEHPGFLTHRKIGKIFYDEYCKRNNIKN